MEQRIESFLKELTELTHKYNLAIGGCGCCLSPYIMDMTGKEDISMCDMVKGELEYNPETKQYEVDDPH